MQGSMVVGHKPFLFFVGERTCSEFSYQMATVAIGWQVYTLTGSAFTLGMVGLVQFIPTAVLVFVAGHAADRFDRRRLAGACQLAAALAAAYLAYRGIAGALTVAELFGAVTIFGVTSAFESPAMAALLPAVTPEGKMAEGSASSTAAFHVANITGPVLGGAAVALSPGAPYVLMAGFWALAVVFSGLIKVERPARPEDPPTFSDLFAGVAFVRRTPAVLGTISLDLFAVLLGGATALLPIYASDFLHTGPWGLGILRGAPAAGALLMAAALARWPIQRRVGMRMFQAVIVFGAATAVFALSRSMALSIVTLAVMGAADTVSMVIRIALVQLATPDGMRGRVGAVNFLFIHASGQLGEFESGVVAAWLGAMPSVLLGGIGSIVVALLWMLWFPAIRKLEKLE
jgi:MFS family permease